METILILAHTESDGTLAKPALEALTAANQLKQTLSDAALKVGLIGESADQAAGSIANIQADAYLAVSGRDFLCSRYSTDVPALEALVNKSGATLVIAPATSRFNRSLPGAACRLKAGIDTHITGIESESSDITIQRWYYRQRMMSNQTRKERPWFITVDSGVFECWQCETGTASVENIPLEVSEDRLRTEVVGLQAASSGAETVRPDAELLFVAGAGWMKKQADGKAHVKEAEDMILDFLNTTGASLGSSKSLVDQGSEDGEVISYMSHLNQIGQTGSTPRHQKGLATCCHGEEPHVIGWRFINERRAVNADPNCGWAQGKADVLYVADAFEVMSKVNELLK